MRTLIAFLLAMIIALNYRIWVSDDGLVAVRHLEQEVQALRVDNDRIAQRNARLRVEVRDLKQGSAAIEARARRELGMIGKHEVLYQFAEQ
jgi:cell division protein FtsB